jgi:hypothetical protein
MLKIINTKFAFSDFDPDYVQLSDYIWYRLPDGWCFQDNLRYETWAQLGYDSEVAEFMGWPDEDHPMYHQFRIREKELMVDTEWQTELIENIGWNDGFVGQYWSELIENGVITPARSLR